MLASAGVALLLFVGVSAAALMAQPVVDGVTPSAAASRRRPCSASSTPTSRRGWWTPAATWWRHVAAMLIVAMQGQMLGRAAGLLARHEPPDPERCRASVRAARHRHVAIALAAVIAFAFVIPYDLEFLAGVFAFGAMISFAIAHLSVIVRFRERDCPSAFHVPLGIKVRGATAPLPTLLGLLFSAVWIWRSRAARGRPRDRHDLDARRADALRRLPEAQDKPLRKRFTIPAEALQESPGPEYGSILVPISGGQLDDDIIGTAGRLAARSTRRRARRPWSRLCTCSRSRCRCRSTRACGGARAGRERVLARAKDVGEEYEGVEVATAMRGRSVGQAIVSEAKRRGVEAIVLARGALARARRRDPRRRGSARDRVVGETTRYVVEKAPCKVILTAAPAGEEGTRECSPSALSQPVFH